MRPVRRLCAVLFVMSSVTVSGAVGTLTTAQAVSETLTAVDDSVQVVAGSSVTLNVLDNDVLPSEHNQTVGIDDYPMNGSVSAGDAFGEYTYTPVAGFTGSDSFAYKLTATGYLDSFANVNVTVVAAPTTTTSASRTTTARTTSAATTRATTTATTSTTRTTRRRTTTTTLRATTTTSAPTTTSAGAPPPPTTATTSAPPATTTTSAPPLALDKPSAAPDGSVTVRGRGCSPHAPVRVVIDSDRVVVLEADGAGEFTARMRAPQRIGRHHVVASCRDRTLSTPLDVVLTTSTGNAVQAPAAGAVAAVGGGVLSFYLLTGFLLVPQGGELRRRTRWLPRRGPDSGSDHFRGY